MLELAGIVAVVALAVGASMGGIQLDDVDGETHGDISGDLAEHDQAPPEPSDHEVESR